MPEDGADKTDKTSPDRVLSVSSVRSRGFSIFFFFGAKGCTASGGNWLDGPDVRGRRSVAQISTEIRVPLGISTSTGTGAPWAKICSTAILGEPSASYISRVDRTDLPR